MQYLCRERINIILIFSVWRLKSCGLDFFSVGLSWKWEKAMKWDRIWHLSVKQQSYPWFLNLIVSREYNSLYTSITVSILPSNLWETLRQEVYNKRTPLLHTDADVLKAISSEGIIFCHSLWEWWRWSSYESCLLHNVQEPFGNEMPFCRLYANMECKINLLLMNLQSKSLG